MKLRQLFENIYDVNEGGEEFDNSLKTIGVCFGRFNPPHRGHKAVWQAAATNAIWYVGTNQSTSGPKDPLPYDVKLQCMQAVWPKVAGHVIPEQSLLTLAARIYSEHGQNVHLKVYTDEEWLYKALSQYNGVEKEHGMYNFQQIDWVKTERLASATNLRAAVRSGDRKSFYHDMGIKPSVTVEVSGQAYPVFDVVAHFLNKYPEKTKKAVAEGVAETVPMNDAVKVLKHYGAEHFKTTSNELHFYKNGRPFSVDLIWNDDATRSVSLGSLNSAGRRLKGQGVAEGFDKEAFRQHMRDLEAREALRKHDPVAAKALDLRGELKHVSRKKPDDDSVGIHDPRHPGYAYSQGGDTHRNVDEIAGAFPSPSTRAKWAADAAASNAAEAKCQEMLKAQQLQKNTAEVEKQQQVNHHSLATTGSAVFNYPRVNGQIVRPATTGQEQPADAKLVTTDEGQKVYVWSVRFGQKGDTIQVYRPAGVNESFADSYLEDRAKYLAEVAMRMQGSSASEKAANAAAKAREEEEKAKHQAIVQAYVKIMAAGQPLPPKMQQSYNTMPDFRKEVDAALANIPGQPGRVDLEQRKNYHLMPKFETMEARIAEMEAELNESSQAKISKRKQQSTAGLNTYGDSEHVSGDYTAYRLGMAVAGANGKDPIDMKAKSWIGKKKSTHPYTQEEQDMLKQAYEAVGAEYTDLNAGDMKSKELDSTHKVSPVAAPKRNKYGV